jgi:beta-1,4-N-acetylglucosaminyltransferase
LASSAAISLPRRILHKRPVRDLQTLCQTYSVGGRTAAAASLRSTEREVVERELSGGDGLTEPTAAATRYAVVTTVYADAPGLTRLASALAEQTVAPTLWVIVVDGDDQPTATAAHGIRAALPFVELLENASAAPERGARVASLLEVGAGRIAGRADVWLKIDADVSFEPDHLETITREFALDPKLGIASGVRIDEGSGRRHYHRAKGVLVEAQCRAYRVECFDAVTPLERSLGWDTIDIAEAVAKGWRTIVVDETSFVHHRLIGARERSRWRYHWREGAVAHRLRYRPGYLMLRALHQAASDSAAVVQIPGFLASVARRSGALGSPAARAVLREQQRTRYLGARRREASRARKSRRGGLLLVADPGGHLQELIALQATWQERRRVWALPRGASPPAGEVVYRLAGPTRRSVRALILNLVQAVRLMMVERPTVLLTTGAGAGVPFVWVAWVFRKKIIFVENSGRIGLSLSGKLSRPFATQFYVQWPELEDERRAISYAGNVLFGDQ